MRNVFLFIRRFFTFFAFLALQAVSLWVLFNYNRFHRAKGLGVANEVTGWFNSKYNKVEDYFFLKEENRRINRFNDSLLNLLPSNFLRKDTTVLDSQVAIPFDTAGRYRHFRLREATVVYNTVNLEKNYLQLSRGSAGGIKDNMGVISSDGCLVGVVVYVSANYSTVMSLLHVKNSVSVSLKKSSESGIIEWDGEDPRFVYLKRLPKSIDVKMGDSVLTSADSFTFPPGYMVGTIEDIKVDNTTGMYILKVRTAANFYKLQQVHIIENLQGDEQRKGLEETRKKIDDIKTNPR
jgi:rod shape-determining protein MreC